MCRARRHGRVRWRAAAPGVASAAPRAHHADVRRHAAGRSPPVPPTMFFPVVLMLFFWVAVFGGGGYLLFRFLRAYEGRSGSPGLRAMEERVRLLEDTLQRVETELAEVAESQRFTTRLLTERSAERHD
jgi:hypothetical protein